MFLVEKDAGAGGSLVTDTHSTKAIAGRKETVLMHDLPTPAQSPDSVAFMKPEAAVDDAGRGMVREYVEVWDYACGGRFRGFTAEKGGERTLFMFFDREVIGLNLKPA